MSEEKKPKFTTRHLLEKKFPRNEYILMEEVSDASGFSRSRSLDYMVAAIWESRGLSITGIEKKSFRNDWLKEMKNPKKQENHFRYCDYFYLLTDNENVAKLEEIPETWGWYHVNGNRIMEYKKAPRLTPIPVTRSFMMAMMRRAASKDGFVLRDEIQERIDDARELGIKKGEMESKRELAHLKEMKEGIKLFEEASGIDISRGWGNYWGSRKPDKIGEIVKMILEGDVNRIEDRLRMLKTNVDDIAATITKQLEVLIKNKPVEEES